MPHRVETLGRTPVLFCDPDRAGLRSEQDALDLIGEAFGTGAEWIALPADRLPAEFFRLRSGLAGAVVQKFANYRLKLAVLGGIEEHVVASDALRDFVRECNRGGQLWFLPDAEELELRLAGQS
ncbi:DUF4180 domain-containing protein [Kitasatospora sp. NPDC002227]|uniref:DUF4180 domain-containing protein n=1 Tax=Kitasatospora sp. NPDC002227 TaxID=3154773 RepID=UPI003323D8C1